MKRQRKYKLVAILLSLSVMLLALLLVLFALRNNINVFYTPSDLLAEAPEQKRTVRLGGMVLGGSVHRKGLNARFDVTDLKRSITVRYNGILPDLFREGQGIIVTGHLAKNGVFKADEVLAKHDENYMPPLLKKSLVEHNQQGHV